jgi:hypothetical protein
MAKFTKNRRSSQVPGQFLGYSLQTTRALMRLLAAEPGTFVSVEVLDDVAVVTASGTTTLEQTKSSGSRNPLADRSPEIWKTIANWVRAVEAGSVQANQTAFEIFLSRKQQGRIAESFAAAKDAATAGSALAAAKESLWGTAPRYPKRSSVGATLAPHLDAVFGASPTIVSAIVARLDLAFGKGSSAADVASLLRSKLISEEAISVVGNQMLGWTKTQIDTRLEQGQSAIVAADAFNSELLAFVRKYDRFTILNCMAPAPDPAAIDIELQNRRYVKQLELIGSDYDSKLKAANDYLRASVNRSIWASKGLVHRSSFDEFEDLLVRAWSAKRDIVAIQSSQHPPEVRGRLVYSECSLVQANLEGRSVPPHFTPGCYHALADQLTVGWHSDFKRLLGGQTGTQI